MAGRFRTIDLEITPRGLRRAALAIWVASTIAPSAASAEAPAIRSTPTIGARLLLGWPDSYGVGLEVHPMHRLRVEGFASVGFMTFSAAGARAKYALFSARSDSGRHLFELSPAAGFRYVMWRERDDEGVVSTYDRPGAEARLHAMYSLWFADHFALEVELSGGGWLAAVEDWGVRAAPAVGLSLGLVF